MGPRYLGRRVRQAPEGDGMTKAHDDTLRAVLDAMVAGLAPFDAPAPQSLSEWAAEHFVLSAEGSHTQGAWEAYPFQRGWMDAMSNDDIAEVTIRKSKRTGFTKSLVAFIAYNAAHRRRKQALWQPTDDDRDSFVRTEVEPALRDVAALEDVRHRRGAGDTLSLKRFTGSVLHCLGGKAATSYRRITVAVALLDELDGFDQQVEKSADPVTLAAGRLEGAPFPKLVGGSTPRIKGQSHVEHRESQAGAVMRYCVSCPSCGVEHPLQFGGKDKAHGFKWDAGQPDTVRHVCPHCHEPMTQAEYLACWESGRWVDIESRYSYDRRWLDANGDPCRPPRHVAFHIWAAYSPQRTWADIVREFLEATVKAKAGEFGPLQGFVNETQGETWEVRTDSADEHELMRRPAVHQLRTVPRGALMLTAGVDVQDDRFEVAVWGYGRGGESWLIDYAVLRANPGDERDWEKLDGYLHSTFPLADHPGVMVGIQATAIDTGGHFTHMAYAFVRTRERRRITAVRGSPIPGQPIKGKASVVDVNWRGRVLKRGVKLWAVGTDTAKDLLHARLQVTDVGPGCVHFPEGLPPEFFHGLTAEGRVKQRTASGEVYRWVKKRPNARNEPLDTAVYSLFAAHLLDLNRYTPAMWDRLEEKLMRRVKAQPKPAPARPTSEAPAEAPEATPPEPAPAPAAPPPAQPKKKGRRVRGRFGGGMGGWQPL